MKNLYETTNLVKVSKLYYEMNLTQKEISELLNFSRPTVSRMLDRAIKDGIVKITVEYPLNSIENLENELLKRFPIKKISVSPIYVEDKELIKKDVGMNLANYLLTIIKEGDLVGISWGTTLGYVATQLSRKSFSNVEFIQLNGGIAMNSTSTGSSVLVEGFSKAFSSPFNLLPVPTIVDSKSIADLFKEDRTVRQTLDLCKKCNIALFGIGMTSKENILYKAGYFNENEYENLQSEGAVGDICSRYYDLNGELVSQELDDRTIGLELKELKEKEYSIAIAMGREKTKAVYGALKKGYISHLFIDEELAKNLMLFEEEIINESSKTI